MLVFWGAKTQSEMPGGQWIDFMYFLDWHELFWSGPGSGWAKGSTFLICKGTNEIPNEWWNRLGAPWFLGELRFVGFNVKRALKSVGNLPRCHVFSYYDLKAYRVRTCVWSFGMMCFSKLFLKHQQYNEMKGLSWSEFKWQKKTMLNVQSGSLPVFTQGYNMLQLVFVTPATSLQGHL